MIGDNPFNEQVSEDILLTDEEFAAMMFTLGRTVFVRKAPNLLANFQAFKGMPVHYAYQLENLEY